MNINFNAEVDVEEVGKLLDLIVALKTKMQEWDMKSVDLKTPKRSCSTCDYFYVNKNNARCTTCVDHNHWSVSAPSGVAPECTTCKYENLPAYEKPCQTCTGNSNWEAKDK